MEPINFGASLRRSWRLLLVLGVIGAVVAVLLPITKVRQPKPVLKYKAQAVVGAAPKGSLVGGGVNSNQITFFASTYAVQNGAVKGAGQKIPPRYYSKYLRAQVGEPAAAGSTASSATGKKNQSPIVTLTGYGTTKGDAVALVNAYAISLQGHINAVARSEQASTLRGRGGASSSSSGSDTTLPPVDTGFQIVSEAGSATRAPLVKASILDSHKVRLGVGLLGGVVLGAVIVIARELLDKRIRTSARAAAAFGFPVVVEIRGQLPHSADEPARQVDVATAPHSTEAEAFRMLRMSVLFEGMAATSSNDPLAAILGNGRGGYSAPSAAPAPTTTPGKRQVVLVVSPDDEPTRPVVAANLAAVNAEAGQRVIVTSTAELGAGQPLVMGVGGGLYDGTIQPADVEARLERTRVEHVMRLPMLCFLTNSSQLVGRGKQLLDAARSVAEVVIVETPSLLGVHHAEALAHAVDVVVFVGEIGKTRISEARRAADLLRRIGAPVLGVVVTNARPARGGTPSTAPAGPGPVPVALPAADTPPHGVEVVPAAWEEPTTPSPLA